MHDHHPCLPSSSRKFRTHSYSSNPPTMEPLSFVNEEGETQLRGTRFRLAKATLPVNVEDHPHQQLDDDYV